MPPTIRDLSTRFTYHPPTESQQLKYTEIRGRALDFAERLVQLVPASPELSTALTKLDELVMHANAGIARSPELKLGSGPELPSKAKPSIEVQSNSQGTAAFATDLVSLLQRVQSWRKGGDTGIYFPHLRDDFPDDLGQDIVTTLLEAAGRRAGGGTSAFPTDLVNLLQRVQLWRDGDGNAFFPEGLREDIALLGLKEGALESDPPEADPEATTVKTEPQRDLATSETDLVILIQRVRAQLVEHGGNDVFLDDLCEDIAATLRGNGRGRRGDLVNLLQRVQVVVQRRRRQRRYETGEDNDVFPHDLREEIATVLRASEATTVKTEPQRDLAAEIAAEDAAMGLLQRVKEWRDGDDNDAFPHDLREEIATALPNFRTDPFSLLQRVQSWREGYDSNDCFPHDLREDIADVLRASADTAVDAPVPR